MDVSWRRDTDIFRRQTGTAELLFIASERDVAESPVFTTEEWLELFGEVEPSLPM